jgi:hypothetical protein
MRTAPRYLLGALLAALLLQKFVESLSAYLNFDFGRDWNLPASFLAAVSIYAFLKAIDTAVPDEAGGRSGSPTVEAVLLVLLTAEFILLIVVIENFAGAGLRSVVAMAGVMCVYYAIEPIYQAVAVLDTAQEFQARRWWYCFWGALTFGIYVLGYLAIVPLLSEEWQPVLLLALQLLGTGTYIVIWLGYFAGKIKKAKDDAPLNKAAEAGAAAGAEAGLAAAAGASPPAAPPLTPPPAPAAPAAPV